MSKSRILHAYHLEQVPRRVLLFAPPVYDVRFPWSEWHQPASLLQLATALRRAGCDLRLVDALFNPSGDHQPKQRMGSFARGDTLVNYWRWGLQAPALRQQLADLQEMGWYPEAVFLLSGIACQWEGCREAISLVRHVFPAARIALYGDYPASAPAHALANSGADLVIAHQLEELVGLPLDLSLYQRRPRIAHLSIGSAGRSLDDLLGELLARVATAKRQERIRHIVLADTDAFRRFPQHVRALCQAIAERNLSVSMHAFGGVHPEAFAEDPVLAASLKRAGLKQIIFTSDREVPFTTEAWTAFLEALREAVARCCEAGYRLRTDDLVATACLGRPREDPSQVAGRLTELAHVAGSIILLPYQPAPSDCPDDLPLEEANGRLFPFAEANGSTYRDYMELLGLGAILNAKWRSRTFDFLGDSLVAGLVRESLVTESWRPPATSGQPVTVGYFGKDGKWVKRPF